jgi:hypothetical protein
MKQDLEAMGALEIQFERVGRATPVLNSLFEQLGPFQGTGIDQSDRVSSGQASPVIGSVPGNGQDDPLLGLIRAFKATFQSHP